MKEFNITGTCIPGRHYMVDTSHKLKDTLSLIEKGKYFIINRPRQYGKTTTFYLIEQILKKRVEYLPIKLSFEGIGDSPFNSQEEFCPFFLKFLGDDFYIRKLGLSNVFKSRIDGVTNFQTLSLALTDILVELNKKVVLMIDEVDKSSNNQLFLHFLGMLREKYLNANEDRDVSFHSVVLAGVHDVKTLKLKLRPNAEKKYNSPWNIAADFDIDMSFNPAEISTMLNEYVKETGRKMDIKAISARIHFWSSGYPFLVSKLCKIIEEKFLPQRENKNWIVTDIDDAVNKLLWESNTLFDDLVKNLENNRELHDFTESILIAEKDYNFIIHNPIINIAAIYGIIRNENNKVVIHNKIFSELITINIPSSTSLTNSLLLRLSTINIYPSSTLSAIIYSFIRTFPFS